VLKDGQTILLIQGGTGGSLVVRRELQGAGCRATVDVAEMDNYPYSLGWPEPTRVNMTIVKRFLQIATLPATRSDAVMSKLGPMFPHAVAAPNAERLAVASAYGVKVPGIHAWLLQTYGLGGDSLQETFHRLTYAATGPYQWTGTPPSLQHQYVIEDVPCGLVAMSSLGRAAGVATPVVDGLEQLGLAGKTVPEIRAIVEHG
jgi:opine dehydrogenase